MQSSLILRATLVFVALAGCSITAASPDASVHSDARSIASGPLGLSDVSILFPLPGSVAASTLLTLADHGELGPLLRPADFDRLHARPANPYDRFRIIGARIDPCFPDIRLLESNPEACRRQIRLVAQPLTDQPAGAWAEDSALHLMYDLPPAEFEGVVARIVELRGGRPLDPGEVLSVHPMLAAEAGNGPFTSAIKTLILTHVGSERLAQFTSVVGDTGSWTFEGFRIGPDDRSVPIFGVEAGVGFQLVLAAFGGDIAPSTAIEEGIDALFGEHVGPQSPGDDTWAFTATDAALREALAETLRIENPNELNAENVDCASCHVAGPLRARAEAMGKSSEGLPRFTSPYRLDLPNGGDDVGNPQRIRAFGYFHGDVVLSQRAVNESAAVAAALNARL